MSSTFDLQGKRTLVTGATGFIGKNVALQLRAEGALVRAMVRDVAKAEPLAAQGIEVVKGDMTDASSLEHAVRGMQTVFHFAGVLGSEFRPLSYFRAVNVLGTRALGEAALTAGIERFIHCSTVCVYGLKAGLNTDENSPRVPSNDPYSDTKLEGENIIRRLVLERGLKAVIVQPAEVYGPGDENWTIMPINLIRSGQMILPDGGRGLIQPIYIDDVVAGMLCAARHGRIGEAYILAGDRPVTIKEFFGHYAEMVGQANLRSVPSWIALTLATLSEWSSKLTGKPPRYTRSAIRMVTMRASYKYDKARGDLSFEPTLVLEAGMQKVRQWLPTLTE